MQLARVLSRVWAVLAAVAFLGLAPAAAQSFDTNARSAWVYDVATGTVLMEKNADEPIPPASMSKLMTAYMLFEAVREGRVGLDTRFPVSTKAREMKGSTMFLNERDRPPSTSLSRASSCCPETTPASWWPRGWPGPRRRSRAR